MAEMSPTASVAVPRGRRRPRRLLVTAALATAAALFGSVGAASADPVPTGWPGDQYGTTTLTAGILPVTMSSCSVAGTALTGYTFTFVWNFPSDYLKFTPASNLDIEIIQNGKKTNVPVSKTTTSSKAGTDAKGNPLTTYTTTMKSTVLTSLLPGLLGGGFTITFTDTAATPNGLWTATPVTRNVTMAVANGTCKAP